jgi:hypothetical protein
MFGVRRQAWGVYRLANAPPLFSELLSHRSDMATSGPYPTIITAVYAKQNSRLILTMQCSRFHCVIPNLIDKR